MDESPVPVNSAPRWVVRSELWAIWILLGCVAVVFLVAAPPNWNPSNDGIGYIGLARNIAAGKGITLFGSGQRVQPPGVSVMFALGFAAPGSARINVMIEQLAAMLVATGMTYAAVAGLAGRRVALFTAALVGLSPAMVKCGHTCLSEPLALALGMAALWAAQRMFGGGRARWSMVVLAGVLGAASALTRSIGLALGPAIIGFVLAGRAARLTPWRSRLLAGAVAFALIVGPWVAWFSYSNSCPEVAIPGGVAQCHSNLADLLGTDEAIRTKPLLTNFPNRVATWGPPRISGIFQAMFAGADGMNNSKNAVLWPGYLLCLPWLGVVAVGWWRSARGRWDSSDFYVPAMLAVLALTPTDVGPRCLLPMLPLLWPYAIAALGEIKAKSLKANRRLIVAALACAMVVTAAAMSVAVHFSFARQQEGICRNCDDLSAAAGYLANRTDIPSATICLITPNQQAAAWMRVISDRPMPMKVVDPQTVVLEECRSFKLLVMDCGGAERSVTKRMAGEWAVVDRHGGLVVVERETRGKPQGPN